MMDDSRRQQLLKLLNDPLIQLDISDIGLLLHFDQALTQRSYAKEQRDKGLPCEDNERMEFMGDCILDFVIGHDLYTSFPDLSKEVIQRFPKYEGKDEELLTDLLHGITNDNSLSTIASKIPEFDESILRGKGVNLEDSIRAGAFEAFIAAIYEVGGFNATNTVVKRLFRERIIQAEPIVSYKNKLQECIQKRERTGNIHDVIDYRTSPDPETPYHNRWHISEVWVKFSGKDSELWGQGRGKKGKDAEAAAAEDAFNTHCLKQE
jgi:dsRNA-specific ribonuclease